MCALVEEVFFWGIAIGIAGGLVLWFRAALKATREAMQREG